VRRISSSRSSFFLSVTPAVTIDALPWTSLSDGSRPAHLLPTPLPARVPQAQTPRTDQRARKSKLIVVIHYYGQLPNSVNQSYYASGRRTDSRCHSPSHPHPFPSPSRRCSVHFRRPPYLAASHSTPPPVRSPPRAS
jgi:hypothetical protein